jgi:hypothetical protein
MTRKLNWWLTCSSFLPNKVRYFLQLPSHGGVCSGTAQNFHFRSIEERSKNLFLFRFFASNECRIYPAAVGLSFPWIFFGLSLRCG